MSQLLVAQRALTVPGWAKDALWRSARAVPSLDLRFADSKSLVDATTGSNLVTFTRASSGTFVGSDGLIKTATTNLLLRSEEFDNAGWTKDGASVSSNSVVAPNGQLTADTLVENNLNAAHFVQSSVLIATSGVFHTFSIYAKAGTRSRLELLGFALSLTGRGFDLSNGTTFANTAGLGEPSSFSIQPVGDGWYRCSITGSGNGLSSTVRAYLNNGTSYAYQGDGTSGIYIWGAQLEQSSSVGEYIPTTSTINSAPRFDHNPTTGESLGLLVEEQRANLLQRSEEFDNAGTIKINATVTANAITSPAGTLTADKMVENTAASVAHIVANELATVVSGTVYTLSVFCKAAERSWVFMLGSGAPFGSNGIYVNLSTGATGSSLGSPGSVVVTPFGNGWYRISFSLTAGSSAAAGLQVRTATGDNGGVYTGDGTSGIYLWGAQLEAGAFPTSYIPTTTTAVTRSADVCSITGSAFSSWYRQDEGSFFCSTFAPKGVVVYGTGDTFDNTQYITASSSNNVSIRSGGAGSASLTAPISTTALTNIAHGYAADNFAAVSNGGAISTDTSGAVPLAQVRLKLGSSAWDSGGLNNLNGTIRRLTYWPQRLANSTLQGITQ